MGFRADDMAARELPRAREVDTFLLKWQPLSASQGEEMLLTKFPVELSVASAALKSSNDNFQK